MKKVFLFILLPLITIAQEELSNNTILINCDSIYKKESITLLLTRFEHEEQDNYFNEKNCVLIVQQKTNDKTKEIFRDTIFSKVQEISFDDFNNDNVKDILIQNISDVRSNWSYNLYLVNPKTFALTKIEGFEEIKNPTYNSKYDIIESSVISGKDYMEFYKIVNNKIYNYNILIYDKHEDNDAFQKDYDKSIQMIINKKM
jgi:hypothetical protein